MNPYLPGTNEPACLGAPRDGRLRPRRLINEAAIPSTVPRDAYIVVMLT